MHEIAGLSRKLELLSAEERRRVIAASGLAVVKSLGDMPVPIRQLVERAHSACELSPQDVETARFLADAADEEYLDLQDRGEEQLALKRFSEARLLTALATGFGGASANDSAEAIYELCKATDDPSIVINSIEAAVDLE